MGFGVTEAKGKTREFPKIKDGQEGEWSLPARISIIVDLGTQRRADFEEAYDSSSKKHQDLLAREYKTAVLVEKEGKQYISVPQEPVRQVVFFADLPTEKMNYGEDIGDKPYRMMLNKSFMGEISGTPLTISNARDNTGKIIKSSPKTFSSKSLASSLGKACGVNFIKNGHDITALGGKPFAATIRNKVKGDDCYTSFVAASPLMEGIVVPELEQPPMMVSFEEATEEQMKFLWSNVIARIKQALDYEGSQIKSAIEAYEKNKNLPSDTGDEQPKTDTTKEGPPF